MIYFVNQYLLSSNSSIEHAEIKRLKLFKKYNVPAKLVTRDFDSIIHATLSRFGLNDQQLINMFDFFAGTINYKGKNFYVENLNLPHDYQVSSGNNSRTVKYGSELIAEIFFIGGTYGLVDHVDYYDAAGNITLRQRFDIRGYKAVDVFFGQDGQIHYERYYRPDGSNYMDRYYVQSVQNTPINSLNVLKNYQGKNYYFDSIDELFSFFLNELNDTVKEPNIFIADRPAISIKPVLNIKGQARKYLWLPISHIDNGTHNGPLNNMLNEALTTDLAKWDGIIVMTNKQASDLQKRLNDKVPIITINGSPVISPKNKVSVSSRIPGQLIYVGRLGDDKQIIQLIDNFAQIKRKVKNARLTLYGYGTPGDTKKYKEKVQKMGLNNDVIFAGYVLDLEKAYDNASLFVDTSLIDGQPLSMAEALSHGLPVLSYNYNYGPSELVKPGINGVLVSTNNSQKFIHEAIKLLKDPSLLQKLSIGAYNNIDSISADHTWNKWYSLIENK